MNILEYRRKKSMPQQELALRVGVTPAYISMLEKGTRTNPGIELLEKIATELDTTVSELLRSEKAG